MKRGLSIAVLIAIFFIQPCLAAQDPCLVLKKDAEVTQEQITLRDLTSAGCLGHEGLAPLLNVPLGRAPLPEEVRTLDRDYLLMRIRQAGVEFDMAELRIPEKITVRRASFEVTAEYLERIVRSELFPRLPWDKDKIQIRSLKADRDLVLPKGETEVEVGPPRTGRAGGVVNTAILFRVNKKYEKRLWLSLILEVPGKIAAASRPLKRNHVLSGDDLVMINANLLDAPAGAVTEAESLIGRRLKRAMPAQRPISINDVEVMDAVKRGEIVTVIAESETVRIKGLGTARQSGRIGDWIKVANLDSGKEISARVVEAGVVAVDF